MYADGDLVELLNAHPGYEAVLTDLSFLLTCAPPPFIYVHDPTSPRLASGALSALLSYVSSVQPSILHAQVDAVTCFSARLIYDTVINALAGWEPRWEDGCANWAPEGMEGQRWNDSLDGFLHGIRAVRRHARAGKCHQEAERMLLVVECAERLRDNVPDLVVPLTRLGELVSPVACWPHSVS